MGDWTDVHILGVFAALVAHQVLGFLWYSVLFQELWTASIGKNMDEMGDPKVALSVGVVASLVMAYGLALLVELADSPDLATGLQIGLVAGIAVVTMTLLQQTMFEDRNRTLFGIYAGYQVVGFALMGAILGAIQ